jgi:hypothetical protein
MGGELTSDIKKQRQKLPEKYKGRRGKATSIALPVGGRENEERKRCGRAALLTKTAQ